jgi:hypothetical protein
MSSADQTLASAVAAAPRRAPWYLRVKVRWQAESLDAVLATGTLPGERAELALRARQLMSPAGRADLARRLEAMVEEAHRSPGLTATISPPRAEVLGAEPDLLALAADLRAPGAIRAQGAARAARLFSDGRLSGRTAGDLRRCARWAAATL